MSNNSFVNTLLNFFVNQNGNNITPTQQSYIDTIKSGDSSKGEELAMNICNSMNVSKDQAIAQARNFFRI